MKMALENRAQMNNMKATIVRLAVLFDAQGIVLLLVFIRHCNMAAV